LNDNKNKYRLFAKDNPDLPLFYQPWWLDTVCKIDGWDIALSRDKGDKITGILPMYIQKIRSFPVLSNPNLTPYQGIRFFYPENQSSRTARYSFENKVIDELADQLPEKVFYTSINFHPSFNGWQALAWKGFKQTTRYSYLLENINDHEAIWASFSNQLKRKIKATEEKFEIRVTENYATLFSHFCTSMKKSSAKHKFNKECFEQICKEIFIRGKGTILEAIDKIGES